jgi:hypothetical protein
MTKKRTRKTGRPICADAIARLVDQGKDISGFFEGKGRMVHPVQRVNVDLTAAMLEEVDQAARNLNVTRQAVIKTRCGRHSITITWRSRPSSRSSSKGTPACSQHASFIFTYARNP